MKDSHHREQQQFFAVCDVCQCTFVGFERVTKALTKVGKLVSICGSCKKKRRNLKKYGRDFSNGS